MKAALPIAVLLAAASTAIFSGCASNNTLAKQQAALPKEQVNAAGLFSETCARCHGADGKAKTFHGRMLGAQNLTSTKWQSETTDDTIIHAIKTGPGAMPAFEKKLSSAEIEALAAYVRTFKPAQ